MNTTKYKLPPLALLLDSNRGVYIPQHFVTKFDIAAWQGIGQGHIDTLQSGPDSEFYWDSWEVVLNNATYTEDGHTWRLHQDGDLWAYCEELMSLEERFNFGLLGGIT